MGSKLLHEFWVVSHMCPRVYDYDEQRQQPKDTKILVQSLIMVLSSHSSHEGMFGSNFLASTLVGKKNVVSYS